MLRYYKTNVARQRTDALKNPATDCWIDLVSPTEEELNAVAKTTGVNRDLIFKLFNDDDELPRIETDTNATLVVIDVPIIDEDHEYLTNPIGIIITNRRHIITISPKNTNVLNDFRKNRVKDFYTSKKTRFLIQILNRAAVEYQHVLNKVYRELEAKEEVLQKSTKNEDLVDLLSTEKTLVYFMSSLKENDRVLERLNKGAVLPLYEGDLDLLEDAIVEYRQAVEMTGIYREILSSLTDTYAAIINNNLNNIMKFLAGITIVISVPTMISSFLGMNVPFVHLGNDPNAALLIFIASVLLSVLIAFVLKKKDLL
ncbi:magnesium transporter CorA family protein [Candidatus Saccharibacteria bacterium]|nr:magnesium transporter CorA family protein [Candidatus Saccharibacteria bacterium]